MQEVLLIQEDPESDHSGGHGPKRTPRQRMTWFGIAVFAWMIFYFVPILKDSKETVDTTGKLKFVNFPLADLQVAEIENSVIQSITYVADENHNLSSAFVKLTNVTVSDKDDKSTTVEFKIDTTSLHEKCEKTGNFSATCDADDVSYNLYEAINSDRFTLAFLEYCAENNVHIQTGIPKSFDGVTIVGVISPGTVDSDPRDEQKCLALLVLVCILWASEAIPLWTTSLLIPLMIVLCDILLIQQESNGEYVILPAADAAKQQLAKLSDPSVILLMGGFSIAAALHKYQLDTRLALSILNNSGSNPKVFIFVNMIVGFVISMFCNNVAAPVLCFFLVTPVLHRVKDRAYCCCLVMSIAFACNIGGMPTPIASPQNAAALQAINQQGKDVSFFTWMAFSMPFCCIMLVATWAWMLAFWKPTLKSLPKMENEVLPPISLSHLAVAFISISTILLWCTFQFTKDFFGDLGLIGLFPVVSLYGTGLLGGDDFKQMDWSILMLLGGGAALGDAVKSSGLLATLASNIIDLLGTDTSSNTHLWMEFMFFNLVVITITNFISHTVGAITMMPVIAKVGASMVPDHTVPFVVGTVLMDSSACALPVSSFPNVLAYGVKDENGESYLQIWDYIKAGIVLELIAIVCMATVGWAMVQSV